MIPESSGVSGLRKKKMSIKNEGDLAGSDSEHDQMAARPRPRRNGAAAADILDSLPMPHGGNDVSADEEDVESQVEYLEHPMWVDLWTEKGRRPDQRSQCWGCRRGRLQIRSLPMEGYTMLCDDLHPRIVEHGLSAACDWAGDFFEHQVLQYIDAPPEVLAMSRWAGVSIVWHFMDHSNIAQYRILRQTLELQYAATFLSTNRLFSKPLGAPGALAKSANVDPGTVRTLSSLLQMLQRQRQADPKKQNTYHQGMGPPAKAPRALNAKERWTGAGPLHS